MSDTPTKRAGRHEPGTYEIRLGGHLGAHWAALFGVPSLEHEPGGTTLIRDFVADQAALHGLLQRVRDLGLVLLWVGRVDPEAPGRPAGSPASEDP